MSKGSETWIVTVIQGWFEGHRKLLKPTLEKTGKPWSWSHKVDSKRSNLFCLFFCVQSKSSQWRPSQRLGWKLVCDLGSSENKLDRDAAYDHWNSEKNDFSENKYVFVWTVHFQWKIPCRQKEKVVTATTVSSLCLRQQKRSKKFHWFRGRRSGPDTQTGQRTSPPGRQSGAARISIEMKSKIFIFFEDFPKPLFFIIAGKMIRLDPPFRGGSNGMQHAMYSMIEIRHTFVETDHSQEDNSYFLSSFLPETNAILKIDRQRQ